MFESAANFPAGIDRDNPWPGLASFSEDSRDFFFGRGKETDELSRLVRRQTLTVLFGQSGLGKSSLLLRYDLIELRKTDERAVELLRPVAAAPNSSVRVRKEYARALRCLGLDQVEAEGQLNLLEEAWRVLAGAGASDLSDLFSAAAYAASTRAGSVLLATLKRDDKTERYRSEALSIWTAGAFTSLVGGRLRGRHRPGTAGGRAERTAGCQAATPGSNERQSRNRAPERPTRRGHGQRDARPLRRSGGQPSGLALSIARQNRGSEALEILAPVLVSIRDLQAKGDDSLTAQQNLVRALYIQAIAQPDTEAGCAQRRASLDEAVQILAGLTDEAKQLVEIRLLASWAAVERAK